MSEWFITDDDRVQCCRPQPAVNPQQYEFMQLNSYPGHVDGKPFYQVAQGTIHIHTDYTEQEILRALHAHGYQDMDDFVMQNASTSEWLCQEDGALDRENSPSYIIDYQLLAEMLFKLENQEYVTQEFTSRNDAVRYIASITGLDLRAHLNQELMLVTAFEKGQQVNFLTTEDEFLSSQTSLPDQIFLGDEHLGLATHVYHDHCSPSDIAAKARFVSLSKPEEATAYLSQFLSGAWNEQTIGSWSNAPKRMSPNARALLAQLLRPVLDACHADARWDQPLAAVRWCKAHPEFMKNLDAVFTNLGLLEVRRHRISVTQGSASVLCCGKELVRYGDEQWLQLKNGKISNGFREKEGKLYGEIIGGYGSDTPDESFRRSALVQFANKIEKLLLPELTLNQKIEQAKLKTAAPVPKQTEPLQQQR